MNVEDLIDQVRKLPPEQAFRVYTDLLAQSPDRAQIAALALRDKARAGELGDECIAVLDACLLEAPDAACVVHFAKALAAFGRSAQSAAPTLVDKLAEIHVVDDGAYWVLDGSLFALGFLGGAAARSFVEELAAEQPSRAVRASSIYDGEMSAAVREKRFAQSLVEVRALIDGPDPGTWREKKTTLKPKKAAASGGPKRGWMVR